MAIELASAIGLGGKRPSILTGLGETIGKIGGDIVEGIQKREAAQAAAQRKEQEKSELALDYWGKQLMGTKLDGIYEHDKEREINPLIKSRLAELTKMQIEGKSPSLINSKGNEYANEIAEKINIAKKDFQTGSKIGEYITKPDEYDTDEAKVLWNERMNKSLDERAKDVDFVEQELISNNIFPRVVSLEKEIKGVNPSFDIGKNYVTEKVIEGTNQYAIDEKGLAEAKKRTFDDIVSGRMTKYTRNLLNRADKMIQGENPPGFTGQETPEQFAAMKQSQLQDAMKMVYEDDWNTMRDAAIREATRKKTINLPNEYVGGRFGGKAGTTTYVQGIEGETAGSYKNEINDLNNKIKGYDAAIQSYERSIKSVRGEDESVKAIKASKSGVMTQKADAETKLKELEAKQYNALKQESDKAHINMKSGKTFTLVNDEGKSVKGVTVSDVLFDKAKGLPIGIVGITGSGKNQEEKIYPLEFDYKGRTNAAELIGQFRKNGDDFVSHLKKVGMSEANIDNFIKLSQRTSSAKQASAKEQTLVKKIESKLTAKPKVKVVGGIEIPVDATPVYSKSTGKMLGYETPDGKKYKIQ